MCLIFYLNVGQGFILAEKATLAPPWSAFVDSPREGVVRFLRKSKGLRVNPQSFYSKESKYTARMRSAFLRSLGGQALSLSKTSFSDIAVLRMSSVKISSGVM